MSDKIGGVYIEIQAKMGSLEADLKRLESRLQQTDDKGQGLSSTFSSMGKYLTAGALSAGLLKIGSSALSAAANMEQQNVAFTTMLGSADKANALLKKIQAFAESTPFQFNELVDASKRMIAFGFSSEEVIPKLKMVGDVAAGLSQPIGDMIYLFGQIKTQGKAMTQDLNQFANRGVPIFEELAKTIYKVQKPTDAQTASIRKMAEQGKITYDLIDKSFKNMTTDAGRFANLMSNQSNTLAGKWSNLNDQLDKTAVLLGQTMATSAKNLVGTMSNLLGIANGLLEKYNQMNSSQQHYVGTLESINNGLNDSGEKLLAIFQYEKQNAKAAYIYAEYLAGNVKLSDAQIEKLQEVLKLNRTIAEIKGYKSLTADIKSNKNTEEQGKALDENKKKWESQKKTAQDLVNTVDKDYVNALGTVDQKLDLQLATLQKQMDETGLNYRKGLISYEQYEKAKDQINAQYAAIEKSRFEKNLDDMAGKYNQMAGGLTQLSGQLSQLVTMNASNQTAAIDNKLQAQLDSIDATYEKEVEAINNSVMSQTEKDAALKALDEKKAREEEALQKAAEKKKRKIAREAAKMSKEIAIFETIIATPQAAFQAYKSAQVLPWPASQIVGGAMAAFATALGLKKLQLIKDQPLPALAEGGIIPPSPQGTHFIAGEAGSSEAVIPLNSQGIEVLKTALQGTSGKDIYINNVITLDGDVIYRDLYRATRDGRVQLASRALV